MLDSLATAVSLPRPVLVGGRAPVLPKGSKERAGRRTDNLWMQVEALIGVD